MPQEFQMDNRGSEDTPFGFVYLEGTRVGFAQSEVFMANGWHSSNEQLQKVADHLTEHFGYGWYAEEY